MTLLTPWTDMEKAAWDYMAAKPAYQDLGLHEFRSYRGEFLPWDPDDDRPLIDSSDLPAIGLTVATMDSHRVARGWADEMSLQGTLLFSTSDEQESRARAEHAAATIRNLWRSADAERSRMQSGGTIAHYEMGPLVFVPHGPTIQSVDIWEWRWAVKLTGSRQNVA